MNRIAEAFLLAAVLPWACGGSTVVDPMDGTGGADGGTTSTSSTSSTSSTFTTTSSTTSATATGSGGSGGSTSTCEYLFDQYFAALQLAQACNTCATGEDPCGHTAQFVMDPCGCPVAVNISTPEALSASVDAYSAWVDASCGPYECGQPCVITDNPHCEPVGPGCDGACAY